MCQAVSPIAISWAKARFSNRLQVSQLPRWLTKAMEVSGLLLVNEREKLTKRGVESGCIRRATWSLNRATSRLFAPGMPSRHKSAAVCSRGSARQIVCCRRNPSDQGFCRLLQTAVNCATATNRSECSLPKANTSRNAAKPSVMAMYLPLRCGLCLSDRCRFVFDLLAVIECLYWKV